MKKVGLLVPKTNLTVEYELQYLYNNHFFNINDIVFYISKLDYNTSYKENKSKFLKELAIDSNNKIKDLEYIGVDYISFFCTSSSVINSNIVINNNPFNALVEEITNKNIKKCLLITPYDDIVGKKIKDELVKNEVAVLKNINLNLLNTADYFDFGTNKLKQFIIDNYKEEYENIIISCTNLPTISIIKDLETMFNNNIISSNSCLFNKIKREMVG
jgi:maleate cis-trans isomerase